MACIQNGKLFFNGPLVFGVTLARRPVHIQCSYPSRPLVKIITLYEPDPQRWVDFKVRRPSDEQ
jgi:hypothetical protein